MDVHPKQTAMDFQAKPAELPVKLNPTEARVFVALVYSSEGNGHDFGCLEDVTGRWGNIEGLTARQVGGYVTVLENKGLIDVCERHRVNDEYWVTQFKLTRTGFIQAGLDPDDYLY